MRMNVVREGLPNGENAEGARGNPKLSGNKEYGRTQL